MPVRSQRNQYSGVNAHLHSHFQVHGGWPGFHSAHITHIGESLSSQLPPGYLVDTEQSLQIQEINPDTGERIRIRPDLTVYDTTSSHRAMPKRSPGGAEATLMQPLIETVELPPDLYYTALLIYQVDDDTSLGRPVTRIELLSPGNKQGEGYLQYREKRAATLKSGLKLIEIDYLHETESPVMGLPSYPHKMSGSYPYNITVSDPTPSWQEGVAKTYAFTVDEPIPTTDVPLAKTDSIPVDFGTVYERTFTSMNAYSYRVDYERLPERFELTAFLTSPIEARMQVVVEMYSKASIWKTPIPNW
jgi:hypothetical protein